MITFCPVPDENLIAKLLDDRRLNAQRTESAAILKWLRHPVRYARFQSAGYCVMWVHNLDALAVYCNAMLREWLHRGFAMGQSKFEESVLGCEDEVQFPGWWGDPRLHSNHRVALLTKFPEHYGQFGWKEQPAPNGKYNYVWPQWNQEISAWELRPPKAGTSTPRASSRASVNNLEKKGTFRKTRTKGASTPRAASSASVINLDKKRRQRVKRKQHAIKDDTVKDDTVKEVWQENNIQAAVQQTHQGIWMLPLRSRSSTTRLDLDSD